jgi:NAD(P)H-hydrate epimerase
MPEQSTRILTREAVRQYDRRAVDEYGVPGVVLMENAGRGVADTLERLGIHGHVAICCGSGNNGGDGFVIARHLQRRGACVTLHCWQPLDMWQDDAGINANIVRQSHIELRQHEQRGWPTDFADALANADWIVDALLGTGAHGNPRPPYDEAIRIMNAAAAQKLAVDIPSGLDCDSGALGDPTLRADHTCTFVATKPGLLAKDARNHVGELHVLDIGAPRVLYDSVT